MFKGAVMLETLLNNNQESPSRESEHPYYLWTQKYVQPLNGNICSGRSTHCAPIVGDHFNATLGYFYALQRPKEITNIDPLQARLIRLFLGRFRTRGLRDTQFNSHSFYNRMSFRS